MVPDYLPTIEFADSGNFFLVAGPCVVENVGMVADIASAIQRITTGLHIPFVFKASYKKANRSRLDSFTGIGDIKALEVLKQTAASLGIPVLTDVHSPEEAALAARYVDVLQIPAFLCRQTDLLVGAAKTGKPVNIKKGQFLSSGGMGHAIEKIRQSGNDRIWVTERGSMFGYQDLVVDYRNIPLLKQFGVPVVLDCTHSLQQPNQPEGVTGGQPGLIETIALAGVAAGVDGIFIETHPDPPNALSDGANMLPLDRLPDLLAKLVRVREAIS